MSNTASTALCKNSRTLELTDVTKSWSVMSAVLASTRDTEIVTTDRAYLPGPQDMSDSLTSNDIAAHEEALRTLRFPAPIKMACVAAAVPSNNSAPTNDADGVCVWVGDADWLGENR
jgi:hypothetical protein